VELPAQPSSRRPWSCPSYLLRRDWGETPTLYVSGQRIDYASPVQHERWRAETAGRLRFLLRHGSPLLLLRWQVHNTFGGSGAEYGVEASHLHRTSSTSPPTQTQAACTLSRGGVSPLVSRCGPPTTICRRAAHPSSTTGLSDNLPWMRQLEVATANLSEGGAGAD
jgi:hypothetical protein